MPDDPTGSDETPRQLPLAGFDSPASRPALERPTPTPVPAGDGHPRPEPTGDLPDFLYRAILAADTPEELDRLADQIKARNIAKRIAGRLALLAHPRAAGGLLGRLFGRGISQKERLNALHMIRLLQQPVDLEPVIQGMYDRRHGPVRVAATETLGEMGLWVDWSTPLAAHIVHALSIAARHQMTDVRIAAARALGRLPFGSAESALLKRLEVEKNPRVKDAVALALGSLHSADAVNALLASYEEGEITYDVALEALIKLGDQATDPLISALRRWNVRLVSRELAGMALASKKSPGALEALLEIVRRPHEPEDMRIAAVRALGLLGNANASPVLWGVYREPTIGEKLRRVIKDTIDYLREKKQKKG
jgi:hypothetical protein